MDSRFLHYVEKPGLGQSGYLLDIAERRTTFLAD
jgi:hypothetical protein